MLSAAQDAAQLAVAKAALLDYTCILTHLFVEGIHRLLCKVLKLEVGQEKVTRLCELSEDIFPVGFVQVCVLGVQTRDLKKLKAPLNIFLLELQLVPNLPYLPVVKTAHLKRIRLEVLARVREAQATYRAEKART